VLAKSLNYKKIGIKKDKAIFFENSLEGGLFLLSIFFFEKNSRNQQRLRLLLLDPFSGRGIIWAVLHSKLALTAPVQIRIAAPKESSLVEKKLFFFTWIYKV
jgi:hypothetical protein